MVRSVDDWTITNPSDAALFHEAIGLGSDHWPMIERVARAATIPPGIAPGDVEPQCDQASLAMALLTRTMHARPGGREMMFRDSLAPQFLLAMLFASQHGDHLNNQVVSLVDAHRQSVAL